jgi:hypothetical protein
MALTGLFTPPGMTWLARVQSSWERMLVMSRLLLEFVMHPQPFSGSAEDLLSVQNNAWMSF